MNVKYGMIRRRHHSLVGQIDNQHCAAQRDPAHIVEAVRIPYPPSACIPTNNEVPVKTNLTHANQIVENGHTVIGEYA